MRIGRRRGLQLGIGAAAAPVLGGGCAPPARPGGVAGAELYVGLGRDRAVALVDTVADQVRARISVAMLGARALPAHIGVGPSGNAVVLPLSAKTPHVGVIKYASSATALADTPPRRRRSGERRSRDRESLRCARVRLDVAEEAALGAPDTVRAAPAPVGLTSDSRGRAYVVLGDPRTGAHAERAEVVVLDLARGVVLRQWPVATEGESVLALAVSPDGRRLFIALWRWPAYHAGTAASAVPTTAGRLVALDTVTGKPQAELGLAGGAAITDLSVAAPPPGSASPAPAVYAVTATPGPVLTGDDRWVPGTRFTLQAWDGRSLHLLAAWSLDEEPAGMAMLPDGTQAYLLTGTTSLRNGWSRQLEQLDLAAGAVTHRWPLPGGCVALAAAPPRKVY
ncbi:MAG: hypothetical protein ACRDJN_23660, partial [Chloroflexota bacterium]